MRMKCVHCQRDNRIGAKFCEQCGTALPAGLPQLRQRTVRDREVLRGLWAASGRQRICAGSPRAPQSYTPKHLAEKILNNRSALEGERKQVTVLFVDIVGSTSQSEHLDPEEVHALMGRAIELMVEEVHRYEGTVNQFLGDGVMALFGAPIAHEDHARRAVQAALAIQRALQPLDEELRSEGRSGLASQTRTEHRAGRGGKHWHRSADGLHRSRRYHQRSSTAAARGGTRIDPDLRKDAQAGRRLLPTALDRGHRS